MVYGGRPLKRYISHTVETMVAKELLTKDFKPNSVITLDVKDNNLVLIEN